jgi:RNA polymerase sigma factor (sigma-70 family)
MEVSALKYTGTVSLHGRAPLLRLQSDERLISSIRRGNSSAFEALVRRYEARLLSFCRHLLASREDAEDVLQEVFAAAFNAILADDRPINVRPWLYRIARNRSLNHLRRIQAIGVDSMDVHFSDNGETTADKVHDREEFRLLVGDIQGLPETQRTALLLREMDALSYEQIAEAMETTVPSVKSLLVRARVSLAEASEARLLSCDEVRIQLGEVAEGLRRRPSPLVRRHLRACDRCSSFRVQLRETNRALAALLPLGPLVFLKKLALIHLGHSASAGSGATAAGSGVTAAGSTVVTGGAATGFVSAGIGAVATKAAAGLAAAAIVTAGAVEVDHVATHHTPRSLSAVVATHPAFEPAPSAAAPTSAVPIHPVPKVAAHTKKAKKNAKPTKAAPVLLASAPTHKPVAATTTPTSTTPAPPPGRTQTQSDETVLPTTTSTPTQTTTTTSTQTQPTTTSTTPTSTTPTDTTTTGTTGTTSTPPPPPPGSGGSSGDPGTGGGGNPPPPSGS